MMFSRFLRVLTSGLLLLAINGVSDDSASACSSEAAACQFDETCVSCTSVADESDAEIEKCVADLGLDEVTSSTLTCSHLMDVFCCVGEVSDEECLDNAAFEELWLCILQQTHDCFDDEITCSGAGLSLGGVSPVVTAFCSVMVLMPLFLWG